MNNKILWAVVGVVVIGGALWYFMMQTPAMPDNSATGSNTNTQAKTSSQGRVVFSVTDAAANMGAVSEVDLAVNKVEVHNGDGWTVVSTTPRTYHLLALNASNKSQLLADANLKADTYDQVRLGVSSVTVKMKDGTTKQAKLPSGELKLNTLIEVKNDNTDSSVNLDFMADKSLHVTGNGQYIFAPVVKIQSTDGANVDVNSDNTVSISGGHVDSTNNLGMDIDGSVQVNFQLDPKKKLSIDGSNVIHLEGILNTQ